MEISEKFKQGVEQHTYQRVDSDYKVNVFLGYNEDGHMSMVMTEHGIPTKIKSSKMIDVQMKKREDGKIALSFDLVEDAYASMFTVFCKDMIVVCERAGKETAIANAFIRWKYWLELFGKKTTSILEKSEIKGLVGELLALRDYMIPKYGVSDAISSWMGPLAGHKDFEIAETWYEVKAVNENAIQVTISSWEQLESEQEGHLIIARVEETSNVSAQAITLNSLVLNVIDLIEDPDDMDSFRKKLASIGYTIDPEYDNYSFNTKGIQNYKVSNDFPRIRRNDLSVAIGNAKYTIMIDGINSFKED